MKIMYVVPNLVIGGVTRVVLNLITELQKKHYNCEIVIVSLTQEINKEIAELDKIKLYSLGMNSSPISWGRGLIKYKKILEQVSPEIVHSHTLYCHYISCILVNKSKKYKLICSEHGTYSGKLKFYKRMNLFRMLNKKADLVTNVSSKSCASYINANIVNASKMIAVYNGIDLKQIKYDEIKRNKIRRQLGILETEKVVGFVGRLAPEKNLKNLLFAIKSLNVKLVIVGDGDESDFIKKIIVSESLSSKVIMLGEKINSTDYYSAFDLFVLPSDTEGLPTALIEAIACYCLSISTNCGGTNEIFPVGYPFIVPVNDSTLLSKCISDILALTENERKNIKNECFLNIRNRFSVEIFAHNWFEIYGKLSGK